jgi:hypothetical protein
VLTTEMPDTAWAALRTLQQAIGVFMTSAWVVLVVGVRFGLHEPAGLLDSLPAAIVCVATAALLAALSLREYRRGPAKPNPDDVRRAAIRTWGFVLAAGTSAGLGYLLSGRLLCLAAGVLLIGLLHYYGPLRLRRAWRIGF